MGETPLERKDSSTASVPAAQLFAGRTEERKALIAAVAQARQGNGSLFLIAGEPGIGKTRLADTAATHAQSEGFRVAWGRCWDGGGAPPYWPWTQIIRSLIAANDSARARAVAGSGFIARLVPELERMVEPASSEFSSSLAAQPLDSERFPLFDSIAIFLRQVAAEQPMMIVLDDCHAADEASLQLLRFVARDLHQSRIILIATYRDAEMRQVPAHTAQLGELMREAHSIMLRGMGESEVEELVRGLGARTPGSGLISALHQATGGNPFFVTEVVRLLIAEGRFEQTLSAGLGTFNIPQSVESTVLRRLDSLSPPAREVLQFAALMGREFELPLLSRISEKPVDSLAAAAEEAVSHGLLTELGGAFGRYRFSHALFADALSKQFTGNAKRQLHNRIAMQLEPLYESDPDDYLPQLAYHYAQALPLGSPQKALDFAHRAAARAFSQMGYEEAVRLYQLGQTALSLLELPEPQQHCELLLSLGEAQVKAGDSAQSKATFEQAFQLARHCIEGTAHMVRAAMGYGSLPTAPGTVDSILVARLEETLGLLAGTDPDRALAMSRLAEELYLTDRNRSIELSAQAVDLARKANRPAILADVLYRRHLIITGPDSASERSALSSEIDRLLKKSGSDRWHLRARFLRIRDLAEIGTIEELDLAIEDYVAITDSTRQRHFGMAEAILAMRAMIDGRFEEAERLATQAFELGQRREDAFTIQTYAIQIAALRREQARMGEMEPAIKMMTSRYPAMTFPRCALAYCYSEMDKLAEAQAEFNGLAENGFAALARDVTWLASVALLARTCHVLDDRANAAKLYELLTPYAGRRASLDVYLCPGWVDHFLGLLAATMRRYDLAQRHYESALTLAARIRSRPWVAETQYCLARVLNARGGEADRSYARELLESARETASFLAMAALTEKIDLAIAASGPAVVSSGAATPRRDAAAPDNVFRKEGELWAIALEGRLFRLRDIKGLGYIAHLLAHPGQEFHALDLVGGGVHYTADGEDEKRGHDKPDTTAEPGFGDAGEMLDTTAKDAYRQRLTEMRDDLEEAREFGDEERVERIEDEIDALTRELSRAVGLGGRNRRAASASERARLSITRAIRTAIEKIAENDRTLATLLSERVKTGTFCFYLHDPRHPVEWLLK